MEMATFAKYAVSPDKVPQLGVVGDGGGSDGKEYRTSHENSFT